MNTQYSPNPAQVDEDAIQTTPTLGMSSERPVPSTGISDEQATAIEVEAERMVNQALQSEGSDEMSVLDGINNVGMVAQRGAAEKLGQFKAKVGESLTNGGSGNEISSGLRNLRRTLDQINPTRKPKGIDRVAQHVPLLSSRYGPLGILKRIAIKYEPVSVQIVELENNLRQGRAMLVKDNVELRKLYQQIEIQQQKLRQAIYFGELIAYGVETQLAGIEDESKRIRLEDAHYNVMMRVMNLRSMEAVHNQYFLSIEMSRQNNVRLGQAVEHTLSLATNVITIGIAIQYAMARQQVIGEVTTRTRTFLADVITGNAAVIKQHTTEIGDLYTNPVIATEKITQAHNDLVEALDSAEQLRQDGLARIGENIAELSRMSREVEEKLNGVEGVSRTIASGPRGESGA